MHELTSRRLADLVARNRNEGERSAYNFLLDIVTDLEKEGQAGSYIASNVITVNFLLSHIGMEVRGKIRIRGARETPFLATKDARSISHSVFIALGGMWRACLFYFATKPSRPSKSRPRSTIRR